MAKPQQIRLILAIGPPFTMREISLFFEDFWAIRRGDVAVLYLFSALLVDRIVGDPSYAWHPVRLVGTLASHVERLIYRHSQGHLAGFVAALLVLSSALGTTAILLRFAQELHPLVEFAVGTFAVYVSIAPRDLAAHAKRVSSALERGNLDAARLAVGAIVGRDTADLDEPGVCRAAVETVAESTVDGVVAPLFWACLLGPLGAFAYRVINTLDSLWGHRDERYERFGTFAARTDDVANFIPARLTLLFITLAAFIRKENVMATFRLGLEQGPKHASPNSGISEAAFAGALNVTLGGANRYDGKWHHGPTFGCVASSPTRETIDRAVALMWFTTWIAAFVLSLGWFAVWALVRT